MLLIGFQRVLLCVIGESFFMCKGKCLVMLCFFVSYLLLVGLLFYVRSANSSIYQYRNLTAIFLVNLFVQI